MIYRMVLEVLVQRVNKRLSWLFSLLIPIYIDLFRCKSHIAALQNKQNSIHSKKLTQDIRRHFLTHNTSQQ